MIDNNRELDEITVKLGREQPVAEPTSLILM